ncbi:MAG: HEAT repeat domain-containing protein [Microcoleaceae cyanobacterium]
MDKRFFNLFNLTEDEAIALLDTPLDQLEQEDSRYVAASHLVNFPTASSVNALMRAIEQNHPSMDNQIVRRKSVETLGRLKATSALPIIRCCLKEEDCYLVENAVWSIGEIGTTDAEILEDVAQLLDKPQQTHRVIIHTLTYLNYQPAVDRIRPFMENPDPIIASAAITAVYLLSGDKTMMPQVVAMLQHPNVLARRLSIQDLVNARYYDAIADIARCPVSIVFRLRGIRLLAMAGIEAEAITFDTIQPHLDQTIRDHPQDLNLVHHYDTVPPLPQLIQSLYETDFGRCYLACQTLLQHYSEEVPAALFDTYNKEAYRDYGAHFHVMKLFGWLKHAPAYDVLQKNLNHPQPQFQKSRAACAIALGELGETRAIPALKACLDTKIWDLKYAALIALEKLGDTSAHDIVQDDSDILLRLRATQPVSQ